MLHKPVSLKNLSLIFPHKTCFENFSAMIYHGQKIAIIGKNGSGKSSLLKMLKQEIGLCSYIPQIIENEDKLSGGQKLMKAINDGLAENSSFLLMDEPSNHLDSENRKLLIKKLSEFEGTQIIITHDLELLRHFTEVIWHIADGKVQVFTGNYDDYMRERAKERSNILQQIEQIDKQKKQSHQSLMREQGRAAKSKAKGLKSISQRKWPTVVSNAKADRAGETSGKKRSLISSKKEVLNEQLASLKIAEVIIPKFSLNAEHISDKTLIAIAKADIYYDTPLIKNFSLRLGSKDRVALCGPNGSGKSTIFKAILNDNQVNKTGSWFVPKVIDIGYLDQHYDNLENDKTIYENIEIVRPEWKKDEIRKHLNDFLFRKNEEVYNKVAEISGGERVRLTLALIAATTPKLLMLDEVTNNLDLETKAHVAQVLKAYPGAMIIISHDADFLKEIGVDYYLEISDGYSSFSAK